MEDEKRRPAKVKPRIKRSDWIKAALDALEDGGIEGIRIERLAENLGVSKSGFYYHFKDRDDLLEKLLDHWLTLDGTPLFRERMFENATPAQRLEIVSEVVDKAQLGRYDIAIRQWARQNPKVKRIWRGEMNKRLSHIRGLFEALGFEGDDLEMRTRTFVGYQVSEQELFPELSIKEKEVMRRNRIAMFTKRD